MGCAASISPETTPEVNHVEQSSAGVGVQAYHHHPRVTRILQLEKVDYWKNLAQEEEEEESKIQYEHTVEVHGEWRRGLSAGGSRNDLELFARNPQYLLVVGNHTPDTPVNLRPFSEESMSSGSETVSAQVRFRRRRAVTVRLRQIDTDRPLHVAFFVYKADEVPGRLGAEYFLCVPPEDQSGVYVNRFTIQKTCLLHPGRYVVVSAAYFPHHSGSFTLTTSANCPLTLQLLQ